MRTTEGRMVGRWKEGKWGLLEMLVTVKLQKSRGTRTRVRGWAEGTEEQEPQWLPGGEGSKSKPGWDVPQFCVGRLRPRVREKPRRKSGCGERTVWSVSILLASWVQSAGDCVNPGLGREITPAVSTQNSRYRREEEAIAGRKSVHETRTRSRTDPPFRDMWVDSDKISKE